MIDNTKYTDDGPLLLSRLGIFCCSKKLNELLPHQAVYQKPNITPPNRSCFYRTNPYQHIISIIIIKKCTLWKFMLRLFRFVLCQTIPVYIPLYWTVKCMPSFKILRMVYSVDWKRGIFTVYVCGVVNFVYHVCCCAKVACIRTWILYTENCVCRDYTARGIATVRNCGLYIFSVDSLCLCDTHATFWFCCLAKIIWSGELIYTAVHTYKRT